MHKGIELRVDINGRPMVIVDSANLHRLGIYAGVGASWRDLLDPTRFVDDGQDKSGLRIYFRPAQIMDGDELDEHVAECEAEDQEEDDDDAEYEAYRPNPRAAHWWDRAELVNWAFRDSGSRTYGLTMVHQPCGGCVLRVESLTEAVRRAAEHECPRNAPPAADPPGVTEFLRETGRAPDSDLPTELHPYDILAVWANGGSSYHVASDYQAVAEWLSDLDFKDWRRLETLRIRPVRQAHTHV